MIAAMSVKAEIETLNVDGGGITVSKLVQFLSGRIVPFLKANDIHPVSTTKYMCQKSDDSVSPLLQLNGTTSCHRFSLV